MKCECCGNNINEEYEELEERTMWNGKKCMCCHSCCEEVEKLEKEVEENDQDDRAYEEEKLNLR